MQTCWFEVTLMDTGWVWGSGQLVVHCWPLGLSCVCGLAQQLSSLCNQTMVLLLVYSTHPRAAGLVAGILYSRCPYPGTQPSHPAPSLGSVLWVRQSSSSGSGHFLWWLLRPLFHNAYGLFSSMSSLTSNWCGDVTPFQVGIKTCWTKVWHSLHKYSSLLTPPAGSSPILPTGSSL